MNGEVTLTVSEFVAALNQTLEYAYPSVTITGELANFRVSKNRWVYFDLKDELASVRFFGTVYQLPGPLEDGMLLQVRGNPRLHPQYGFSVTVQAMMPVGEGSIKRAAALLQAKLEAEGLFDESRKRALPYPPATVGLITSSESAAYHDFMKILNERWGGLDVRLADVQVQGEAAVGQIVAAIEYFNQQAAPPEVLVITRGGGSPEDLAAFSTEQVTRAVAASRIPTLVAIGHEVDISLAEMAADRRASTPSNAAQFLVPDRQQVAERLAAARGALGYSLSAFIQSGRQALATKSAALYERIRAQIRFDRQQLASRSHLLRALNPEAALARGFVIVRSGERIIRSGKELRQGEDVSLQFKDTTAEATIKEVQ